jgi:hypothetical protein
MMESTKRRLHDDILAHWVAARDPKSDHYGHADYDTSHIQSVKIARIAHIQGVGIARIDWRDKYTDSIQSYGAHFPLAECYRTPKGTPRLFLLNGDLWRGQTGFGKSTSGQQSDIRRHVAATGVQSVILPFSAIDAAGIEHASIRVLALQDETWETVRHVQSVQPDGIEWAPVHELVPGTGYGVQPDGTYGTPYYASMSDIPGEIRAYFDADGNPLPEYEFSRPTGVAFGRKYTRYDAAPRRDYASGSIRRNHDWHGNPGKLTIPPVYRFTGMRVSSNSKRDDSGNWYSWSRDDSGNWIRETRVHTLGASVFRAAYRGTNGKRYFANFLSAVDTDPHGSGYFLVQLPRSADVSSVEAATESLKPETVRAAESIGIECKRQGDLFAIPTEFTLRDLRRMGADVRMSRLASAERRAAIREKGNADYLAALERVGIPAHSWEPITDVQRRNRERLADFYRARVIRAEREFDATVGIHLRRGLYGTRHTGRDIAILPSGVVLARGTIRHTGGQHRALSLGNVWHIVARNTVPLAR